MTTTTTSAAIMMMMVLLCNENINPCVPVYLCMRVCVSCVLLCVFCLYLSCVHSSPSKIHRKYKKKPNTIRYIYIHTHTNEGRTTIVQSLLCNRCRSRHDIHTCSHMYVPLARDPRSQCVSLLIYTRVRERSCSSCFALCALSFAFHMALSCHY